MCECQRKAEQDEDGVKWLALAIRQSAKLLVTLIDQRYGESRSERERRERERRQNQQAA